MRGANPRHPVLAALEMLDHAVFSFEEESPPINPCIELFDALPFIDFAANFGTDIYAAYDGGITCA